MDFYLGGGLFGSEGLFALLEIEIALRGELINLRATYEKNEA